MSTRDNGRRIFVLKWIPTEEIEAAAGGGFRRKTVLALDQEGRLLSWGVQGFELAQGVVVQETAGVVELEDGTIRLVPIGLLRFPRDGQ